MSRIIVLQFDSNDNAELFLGDTDFEQRACHAKIIGKYYLPSENVYCRCPDKQRRALKNWVRHKKLKLYICVKCKKPSRAWRKGILVRLQEALGKNLLD